MLDPVPFPGGVDLERLRQLLALQTETASLDYKQRYDLSDPASKYDFVKDCAAMMSRPQGGYLVIGVDGRGEPVGADLKPADFDESRLRPLLEKHLEGGVTLLSAAHELEGGTVVVVFLARRADGLFPIVKSDFDYTDSRGKQQWPLRAGDVFVRDGTTTRRWRSGDLPGLIAPHVDAARREERGRVGELVAEARVQFQAQALTEGPVTGVTWQLSAADFDTVIAELSRRGDTAALRLLSVGMSRDGTALMDSREEDAAGRLQDLLDRAAAALAYAVALGDRELLTLTLKALTRVYRHGGVDSSDASPRDGRAAGAFVAIASRVLGVVALAVRLEEWWAVRPLVLQPVGTQRVYASWLRHALIWGGRHDAMPKTDSGQQVNGVLIGVARQAVNRVAALHLDARDVTDAPALGQPPAAVDPVTDSLCQADLLWCLVAHLAGGRDRTRDFYPSFSAYYEERVSPIVRTLTQDADVRAEVLPDVPLDQAKGALREVLVMATHEGVRFGHEDFGLDALDWK